MANENDNIQKEGTENNEEPKHHHTWMENIVDKIQKMDTEFPLSGGETEEDFESVDDSEEESGEAKAPPEEHQHHSLMDTIIHKIQKLDTEFPLSGGETEEDFEDVDDKEEDEEKK